MNSSSSGTNLLWFIIISISIIISIISISIIISIINIIIIWVRPFAPPPLGGARASGNDLRSPLLDAPDPDSSSCGEQACLVCQSRPFYPRVLSSIGEYVENDLRRLDAEPSELLAKRPMEDPLEYILSRWPRGVPSIIYDTVRDLRQARAVRLGAMQRKLPAVHFLLLYALGLLELLAFPFLGERVHGPRHQPDRRRAQHPVCPGHLFRGHERRHRHDAADHLRTLEAVRRSVHCQLRVGDDGAWPRGGAVRAAERYLAAGGQGHALVAEAIRGSRGWRPEGSSDRRRRGKGRV
ncbi:unnamed protein product, partial [Prorocentrum cordatum]